MDLEITPQIPPPFFFLTDSAEVIQSRVNDQEGREEFYVHYVGCECLGPWGLGGRREAVSQSLTVRPNS